MSKKIIVTITESQVVAEHVDPSAEDPIVSRAVVAWNAGDLSTALHQSLEDYSDTKQIKMMLTESLYHLTGFVVDKKHAGDRKYIKQKASEVIIEDLNIVRWDYAVTRIDGKNAYIQVFCLTKVFDTELRSLEPDLQFDIDAILPKSIVIADSFAEKDQSFILIYGDEVSRVIAISKNGLLVFSTSFQLESIKEKFNQVITYAERYLNFSTIKVIFSGVDENTVLEKKSKYIAANVDIIASQNLADFRNLAGADKKVLNLQLKKNSLSTVSDVTDLSSVDDTLDLFEEDTQVKSNLFIGLLVFISIIGVGVGFFVIKFLLNS